MASFLRLERRGEDLYPALRRMTPPEDGRPDLIERFGIPPLR